MIFPVRTLIQYITQYVTLEPGEVIATGTPSGVGSARKPPIWLKRGDQVRIDISHIGTLEHGID
jgi:2-keto-4-pentenoate hydratase/2-oxohepta-3-ene-1,7-dioic acid hydratase in catechol pathway